MKKFWAAKNLGDRQILKGGKFWAATNLWKWHILRSGKCWGARNQIFVIKYLANYWFSAQGIKYRSNILEFFIHLRSSVKIDARRFVQHAENERGATCSNFHEGIANSREEQYRRTGHNGPHYRVRSMKTPVNVPSGNVSQTSCAIMDAQLPDAETSCISFVRGPPSP